MQPTNHFKTVVTVLDKDFAVTVHKTSKTVWTTSGFIDHKTLIEARGKTTQRALDSWEARAKGHFDLGQDQD